jgi:hypothetical protein
MGVRRGVRAAALRQIGGDSRTRDNSDGAADRGSSRDLCVPPLAGCGRAVVQSEFPVGALRHLGKSARVPGLASGGKQRERRREGGDMAADGGAQGHQAADQDGRGAEVRALVHAAARASLATAMPPGDGAAADPAAAGAPNASLVAPAPDMAGVPLLLLSDLAQHTRNLAADPRASLLVDGTDGYDEPLAGPRASLQGRLRLDDTPATRGRYLRWQPQAAQYAQLGDFKIYRLELIGAHLVSGFGKVHWLAPAALQRNIQNAKALMKREADIVEHMNSDHLDALADIAGALLGGPRPEDGAWILAGVDSDGADLARGPGRLRLDFAARVTSAEDCRRELVRATHQARQRSRN